MYIASIRYPVRDKGRGLGTNHTYYDKHSYPRIFIMASHANFLELRRLRLDFTTGCVASSLHALLFL